MSTREGNPRHGTDGTGHAIVGLKDFLGLFLILLAPAAIVVAGSFLAGSTDAFDHALPLLGAGLVAFSVLAACVVRRTP